MATARKSHGSFVLFLVVAMAGLAGLLASPAVGQEPTIPVERVVGEGAESVAAAIAKRSHPAGADTAVIVATNAPSDALVSAPLARQVGGPLLLTAADRLGSDARTALADLGVKRVILVGRTASGSSEVGADALRAGYDVERIAGPDRYATAARLAAHLVTAGGGAREILLLRSHPAEEAGGTPDAVVAAPLAAASLSPVLLTTSSALPPATRTALRDMGASAPMVIVGGTAAVADSVAQELADLGHPVRRLSGSNRYETAHAVVEERSGRHGSVPPMVWVASGHAGVEALAAAPAAAEAATLILTAPDDLLRSWPTTGVLLHWRSAIEMIVVVGGSPSVSDLVIDELRRLPQATSPLPECLTLLDSMRFRLADIVVDGVFEDGPALQVGDRNPLLSPASLRVERYDKGTGPAVIKIQTAYTRGTDGTIGYGTPAIEPEAGERWRIYGLRDPDLPDRWVTSPCDGSVRK